MTEDQDLKVDIDLDELLEQKKPNCTSCVHLDDPCSKRLQGPLAQGCVLAGCAWHRIGKQCTVWPELGFRVAANRVNRSLRRPKVEQKCPKYRERKPEGDA